MIPAVAVPGGLAAPAAPRPTCSCPRGLLILIDSLFVGAWAADRVHAHTDLLSLVVNTRWHADHVRHGLVQAIGGGSAVGVPDSAAVACRDLGCCRAVYLDRRVRPQRRRTTRRQPDRAARRRRVAGHPHPRAHRGGLAAARRAVLVVGDACSAMNSAVSTPHTTDRTRPPPRGNSLHRLIDRSPRVLQAKSAGTTSGWRHNEEPIPPVRRLMSRADCASLGGRGMDWSVGRDMTAPIARHRPHSRAVSPQPTRKESRGVPGRRDSGGFQGIPDGDPHAATHLLTAAGARRRQATPVASQ